MIKDVIIFTAGAALGGVVSWQLTKKHYLDISNEEISEIREHYKEKEKKFTTEDNTVEEKIDPEVVNYMEIAKQYSSEKVENNTRVISEKEFIDDIGNVKETYVFFDKDEIIIDAYNERQDNVIDDIGLDLLKSFEGQILYARNDELGMDYEVLMEARTYEDYMTDDTEAGEGYQE